MKTSELRPLEVVRRVDALNIILHRIQASTIHPAFFHARGLHGFILADHAGEIWWNDPFRGFIPMSQSHKTPLGTAGFKNLLRFMYFHAAHNVQIQRVHFPTADELGLNKIEWEAVLMAAQVHGLVSA
ncbi:hypothetical protein [Deinococcus cellulosilyticus]|uniref:Uncharacterized protein n=1 Tax=Deinococcus cellulosilyticus (strain DSM 18568 / NBRC 106333 / KACC 11606 / 5516J-15) TaxID=1223518 RepID=A0A511N7J8_DEIC1|nr:hypothetical protein [Deinococcus cellulosilyticus]GEM48810.1 hypothetical protein DC3_44450 [Deinococcus cellulosilyticus NBRC 106333 = KACC 11606]